MSAAGAKSRWVAAAVLLIAVSVSARWWGTGWMRDDFVQRLLLSRSPDAHAVLWRLGYGQDPAAPLGTQFSPIGGGDGQRRMLESGILPWWVTGETKCAFPRPVSALTHRLDYALWPNSPFLMHVHGTAWLALLGLLGFVLFRTIGSPHTAGVALAALLYATHSHATASSWIGNRNALIYACLSVAALILFVRHAQTGRRIHAVGSWMLLGLALLAGEGAVAALGYVVAWAAVQPGLSVRRRSGLVLPYLMLCGAWYVGYTRLGYGAWGCPGYTNPAADMGQFWRELPRDGLAMARMLYGLNAGPAYVRWAWFVPMLAVIVWRAARSTTSRFWLLGSLLSLVPYVTTTPHPRHLLLPTLGASALIAELCCWLAGRRPLGGGRLARLAGPAAAAGLILILTVATVRYDGHMVRNELRAEVTATKVAQLGGVSIQDDATVIMLSNPGSVYNFYAPAARYWLGSPVPRQVLVVAPPRTFGTVVRTAPDALLFEPAPGQGLDEPRAGDELVRGRTRISFQRRAPGEAPAVLFRFGQPIDGEKFVLLDWDTGQRRFERCAMPAVGQKLQIDQHSICR